MAKFILLAFLFTIAVFIIGYLFEINSEAYKYSKKFIERNLLIREHLGEIRNTRLAFFEYGESYNGTKGKADFKLYVQGDKKSGEVFLELKKALGDWKVIGGKLKLATGEPGIDLIEKQ